MKEEWKDITGWEGLYKISNTGKVFSYRKNRLISTTTSNCGYEIVSLWLNSKNTNTSIHRLVAIHFIDNPDNKPFVNHIDGDKKNNVVSNLEWNTRTENESHASINKLKAFGFRNKKTKLKERDVDDIRTKRISGVSVAKLAKEYGVGISHIYKLINYESRI